MDTAVLFALAAALSFACADMGMRAGLQRTDPFVGSIIQRFIGIWTLVALIGLSGTHFPPPGQHYFWIALAGAFNPGLFSIFFMFGIAKIGVARAAPIKGSSPLFAAVLAMIFLGERPEWYHLGGVILIVSGIMLVSSGRTEGRWRRIDALWPIGAAVFSAIGAIIWRKHLASFPDPLGGALIGLTSAFTLVLIYTIVVAPGTIPVGIRKAWKPFILVGIVAAIGQFCFAAALHRAEIFRMIPIIQTSPLITIVFALIFLRSVEFITWRVPAGAVLTVTGAILVSLRLA